MAKNNVMKLVATIMVLELIMVNIEAAATHNNGGYGKKVSLGCIASCALLCAASEELMPICLAGCIVSRCEKSDSEVVKNCATSCARNMCSKYIGSGENAVEQCVVNECVDKCLPGA